MKETIRLKYVVKGTTYYGKINREQFIQHMAGIAKMFEDNNEISTKLVQLLPNIVYIKINQDLNDTQDVPYIIYGSVDKKTNVLRIRRNHRIIWAFLQRYCDEAVK